MGYGGTVVVREKFVQNLAVPDLGAIGPGFNMEICNLDYAFAETSASDLWTEAFGEMDYISVDQFVEKSFETFQADVKAPVQNVMNNVKDRKAISSSRSKKMPLVKLDDYSKIHNPLCEGRRELFLGDVIDAVVDPVVDTFVDPVVSTGGWVVNSIVQGASCGFFGCTGSGFSSTAPNYWNFWDIIQQIISIIG